MTAAATVAICVGCGGMILDRYVLSASPGLLQWHVACLRCVHCGQTIDEASRTCFLRHHRVYCTRDFHRLFGRNQSCKLTDGSNIDATATPLNSYESADTEAAAVTTTETTALTPSDDVNPTLNRYRTILTEYQLRVLRACYAVSARPDPETRDQLTEMTGLSARVIRVWFQNRRCKDKKRACNNYNYNNNNNHNNDDDNT